MISRSPQIAPHSGASGLFGRTIPALFVLVALAFISPAALTQGSSPFSRYGNASLIVRVTSQGGQPIDLPARVTVSPEGDMSGMQQSISNNGTAQFGRLHGGRYTVSVVIPGYKNAIADVDVLDYGTVETSVAMEIDDDSSQPVVKGMILAPKAKKEVEDGMAAMHAGKYPEAQEHLEAAYKLAPGNPDVNDTLGELFLLTKDFDKSQDYLQRAASIDPENVNALVDMGQLRIQQRNFTAAQVPLEKVISFAPQYFFAHWLLGTCYLQSGAYEKARVEAAAAIKAGKGVANDGQFLMGQSLAALGRNADAVAALQLFIRQLPKDPYVASAQTLIARLQANPLPAATAPPAQ